MLKRSSLKKKHYTLKKSPLKKISERGLIKKEEKAELTKKQMLWFKELWNKNPHYCKSCSKYLGEEPLSLFFDHLLEKNKYEQYRFTEENIMIVCADCHSAKTNGFPTPKHKYAIERVKKLHLNNEL